MALRTFLRKANLISSDYHSVGSLGRTDAFPILKGRMDVISYLVKPSLLSGTPYLVGPPSFSFGAQGLILFFFLFSKSPLSLDPPEEKVILYTHRG